MTSPSPLAALASGGYAPPGVYVEEIPGAVVSTTGLPPTVVAIVGPSIGHQHRAEQFLLAEADRRLAKKGIDVDSVVVTKVSDGSVVSGADYDLTPTSSGPDYYVDIARATGGSLSTDTLVFVAYDYTDPDYYNPKVFSSFESVKDSYGEPLNQTPPTQGQTNYQAVLSPLSLAARIAFENGAASLVLCATTPPPGSATTGSQISAACRSALAAAYAKISGNVSVNVVVPITDRIVDGDAAGVGVDLQASVDGAATEGLFRVALLGFDPVLVTTAPDTLASTGNFRSKRLVLCYSTSGGMAYPNTVANQSMALGHQYLAAGLAGRLAAIPVQKALTAEVLRSFSGLVGTPLSSTAKNQYAAAGVLIVEVNRLLQIICRHGVTSETGLGVDGRELSVVRALDFLVTLIQNGISTAGLLGQPITGDTPINVKSVVSGLLEHAVTTGVVASYSALQVKQSEDNPTVIEVRFAYLPPYPTNYILVTLSVDSSTGQVSSTVTG